MRMGPISLGEVLMGGVLRPVPGERRNWPSETRTVLLPSLTGPSTLRGPNRATGAQVEKGFLAILQESCPKPHNAAVTAGMPDSTSETHFKASPMYAAFTPVVEGG